MTKEEIAKLIAESTFVDWFNSREATFVNPDAGINIPLKGILHTWEFFTEQVHGFDAYEQQLSQDFITLKDRYVSLRREIENLVKNVLSLKRVDDNQWNNIRNAIQNASKPKLLYDSAETQFLIDVHNTKPQYYQAAYQFLVQQSLNSLNHKDSFSGYMLAYEFASKDYSHIAVRRDKEKKSIKAIRSEFEKNLADADVHLTKYLSEANQKVVESSKDINTYLSEKKKEYSDWFDETSNGFAAFVKTTNEQIRELEELYEKKLQLAAPAVYWRRRAKRLRLHGAFWLSGLVGSTAVALSILLKVLDDVSTGTLERIFENTGTAIKWSVIALTIISFLAYAIRTFAKLTFSSFHLSRDAEEREQLTYVYLALEKQKAVDPTERHLIMQSLFSRADTGLLKDEGSPTMPGNIFDKALINKT